MSIIRTVHNQENPYVQLNKKALWDPNLSLTAVGLWARCMSRPDDWTFCVKELISKFKEGKDAIYRAINELVQNGYAIKGQRVAIAKDNSKSGKRKVFQPVDYIFFEFKISHEEQEEYSKDFQKMFPLTDFPLTERPLTENPPLLKKAISDKETECLKRATNRCKSQCLPKSPSLNRKNEIAFLAGFAADLGLYLSEKDLGIWLSKYDLEKIKRNIFFATKRKYKNLERFLQGALENDYALEAENIELNRAFMKTFSSKHNLSVKITQRYVKLSSDKEIYFNLPPSQFNQALINHYSNQEK